MLVTQTFVLLPPLNSSPQFSWKSPQFFWMPLLDSAEDIASVHISLSDTSLSLDSLSSQIKIQLMSLLHMCSRINWMRLHTAQNRIYIGSGMQIHCSPCHWTYWCFSKGIKRTPSGITFSSRTTSNNQDSQDIQPVLDIEDIQYSVHQDIHTSRTSSTALKDKTGTQDWNTH